MNINKRKIAITMGDAAGIGPEIVIKAIQNEAIYKYCYPIVIGDAKILNFYINKFNFDIRVNIIDSIGDAEYSPKILNVIDNNNVSLEELEIGGISAINGYAVIEDTEKAIQLALNEKVDAVIAGPHTKKSIELAGFDFDGYPSFVAKQTNTKLDETFLMLATKDLRIVNTTLHVSLKEAVTMINKELVLNAIRSSHRAAINLGIHTPKIAVAGLNPHAGEFGMFGDEEITEINPAIREAKNDGIDAYGSFGSDSLFSNYLENPYDIYVVMYHDQGHIPMKLVAFDKITAFTIGTPILFCTVGHGSAPDIAGKNLASPNSLIESIRLISPIS